MFVGDAILSGTQTLALRGREGGGRGSLFLSFSHALSLCVVSYSFLLPAGMHLRSTNNIFPSRLSALSCVCVCVCSDTTTPQVVIILFILLCIFFLLPVPKPVCINFFLLFLVDMLSTS